MDAHLCGRSAQIGSDRARDEREVGAGHSIESCSTTKE
jgi:hypothetical protein